MPSKRHHLEFDEILRNKGIKCRGTDENSIHAKMDKGDILLMKANFYFAPYIV
jgi:hypothetical protein